MIQRLIHRLKHLWDKEQITRKLIQSNNTYYHIYFDKKGRACCPACLNRLNITWRIGWGPFDQLIGMEGCYVVPVVYVDYSGNPIPKTDNSECSVYCLECPDMILHLEKKKW